MGTPHENVSYMHMYGVSVDVCTQYVCKLHRNTGACISRSMRADMSSLQVTTNIKYTPRFLSNILVFTTDSPRAEKVAVASKNTGCLNVRGSSGFEHQKVTRVVLNSCTALHMRLE